jgi:hypothetical protein
MMPFKSCLNSNVLPRNESLKCFNNLIKYFRRIRHPPKNCPNPSATSFWRRGPEKDTIKVGCLGIEL